MSYMSRMDFGDWCDNGGEEEAMQGFLEDRMESSSLVIEAMQWVIEQKIMFDSVDEALEAFVRNDTGAGGYAGQWDAWLDEAYKSYRSSGPEPERDGD